MFLYLTNLLVLCFFFIFLPNARWACFSVKLLILGLFLKFACFYLKITWHHWSAPCGCYSGVAYSLRVGRFCQLGGCVAILGKLLLNLARFSRCYL